MAAVNHGHRGTDDEQGAWHGDVTHQTQGLADFPGDIVESENHDENGDIGGHKTGAIEHAPVETVTPHGIGTENEDHAADEDRERVGHIEQRGIENRLITEDGGRNRIADEAHVAKHQHETIQSADRRILHIEARQLAAYDEEHNICEEPREQQRQDEFPFRKHITHDRRDDQAGASKIDDKIG